MDMKYFRVAKHKFYRLAAWQNVLHCIGDSHVQNFEFLSREYLLSQTDMRFCVVQGATNLGLANPHSQTQAMPIFMDYLNKVNPEDHAIFCLGEVDCGFVIWYRADKHGTPVQEQFELSLTNYFGLIEAYMEKISPANVIVCSVPLPTIPDHQLVKGDVANKRLVIKATQKQRTDLTIEYNDRLREYCGRRSIHFMDLQKGTLDQQTGVVSGDFVNENPLDHHLEPAKLAHLIIPQLNRFGLH
jgi:hypothetical protein